MSSDEISGSDVTPHLACVARAEILRRSGRRRTLQRREIIQFAINGLGLLIRELIN